MDFEDLVQRKKIRLFEQELRGEDLDVLTKVLRKTKKLRTLDLRGYKITLSDGKITDALKENRTLRELFLAGNKIGKEGAKRLADALKVNNSLQCLGLAYNQIGAEGAKSLADALKINKTLELLALEGNQIGADGAHSLSAALMANKTLDDIGLSSNCIGDDGAQSLASSLLKNESLRVVGLLGNEITDKGAKSLANALRCNRSIEGFYLGDSQISDDVIDDIQSILNDPNRKDVNNTLSMMKQLLNDSMCQENALEIARLKGEIARRDEELASKDEKIASLRVPFDHMRMIWNTIDLSCEAAEQSNKRTREDDAPESNLASLHRKNQKIAHIKQEKDAVEATLTNVTKEKETAEADLEGVREDLEDANELVQQQTLTTDIWQRRFDELASLVTGQVDGAMFNEIRNRSLASGS